MKEWPEPVVKDFFGNTLEPGDMFAYAVADGHGQQQYVYRFIKLVKHNVSQPDYDNPWRVEAEQILPDLKQFEWYRRNPKKNGLLHTDLFTRRAIKVELPRVDEHPEDPC